MAGRKFDLRSIHARPIFIKFINNTEKTVSVLEIDVNGLAENEEIIAPMDYVLVQTFEGQYYFCLDTGGNFLLLNNRRFFSPAAPEKNAVAVANQLCPHWEPTDKEEVLKRQSEKIDMNMLTTQCVYISMPFYTLSELSAVAVINSLRNHNDLARLELAPAIRKFFRNFGV